MWGEESNLTSYRRGLHILSIKRPTEPPLATSLRLRLTGTLNVGKIFAEDRISLHPMLLGHYSNHGQTYRGLFGQRKCVYILSQQ